MVSFIQAIKLFYKNYLNFDGRAQRSEYWWAILYQVIAFTLISVIAGGVMGVAGVDVDGSNFETGIYAALIIYLVANLMPNISLAVRRFHDLGQTGWLVLAFNLLGNIPVIGIFIFLGQMIWYALPGNKGSNQYGPDPLAPDENVFD